MCLYALLVAIVGYVLAAFLARLGWPFGPEARAALGAIADADAVIAVLLLPGFLYTRLALSDRHSIAGHLRRCHGRWPTSASASSRPSVVLSRWCCRAAGCNSRSRPWSSCRWSGPVPLLYRRRTVRETAELVRLGAPRWLDGVDVPRARARGDVRFFSALGRSR